MRNQKVMLDRDLAELYAVAARRLREQVKRNVESFPIHFMFQLTDEEVDMMVAQNAIPSRKSLGGALPYVFTEHGVLMLANVLRSERAIKVSIKIIEVFVKLREVLLDNTQLRVAIEKLEKTSVNHTKNLELVFQYIDELMDKKDQPQVRKKIGYQLSKR